MQDLASEFSKKFSGGDTRTLTAGGGNPLPHPTSSPALGQVRGANTPELGPKPWPPLNYSAAVVPLGYIWSSYYENHHVKVKVIGAKKCDIPYTGTLYVCLSAIGLKYLHCKTLMGNNFGSVEKSCMQHGLFSYGRSNYVLAIVM